MQPSPARRHFPRWLTCAAVSMLAGAWLVLFPQLVSAQTTITVTTSVDNLINDGNCSLREAIQSANLDLRVDACAAGSGADTIILPAGVYTITLAGASENNNQTGDYDLSGSLEIRGAGAGRSSIVAAELDRIFHVHSDAIVALAGVRLSAGLTPATEPGGAILNEGRFTIDRSLIENSRTGDQPYCISDCADNGGAGGGIANVGTLTMTATTVRSNRSGLNTYVYNDSALSILQHAPGGGIYNTGTLRIVEGAIAANEAGEGAGIYNVGQAAIFDTAIFSNSTTLEVRNGFPYGKGANSGGGAGIANASGKLEMYASAVFSNRTSSGGWGNRGPGGDAGAGAGILNKGLLLAYNSTVAQNSTGDGGQAGGIEIFGGRYGGKGGDGGGIYNTGTALLNNMTIALNTAGRGGIGADGGGPYGMGAGIVNEGELRLKNTIAGDNSGADGVADCAGDPLVSLGFNLISSSECAGVNSPTDRLGVPPQLSGVADFGGPTYTCALYQASPAIDAGSCFDSEGQPVTEDQRMVVRPQGKDCDIGAYEFTTADPLAYVFLPICRP